jgi:hypothetical protein
MQLILFNNAARQLERMEAGGGTPDAVARGSVLTACAKLIRSLEKLMWGWKRRYVVGDPNKAPATLPDVVKQPHDEHANEFGSSASWVTFSFSSSEFPTDNFFYDDPYMLDPMEVANLFTYDLSTAHL